MSQHNQTNEATTVSCQSTLCRTADADLHDFTIECKRAAKALRQIADHRARYAALKQLIDSAHALRRKDEVLFGLGRRMSMAAGLAS